MFGRRKTYLALYEVHTDNGQYQIDFAILRRDKPPKPKDFVLRKGYTRKIIIFEVKEVFDPSLISPFFRLRVYVMPMTRDDAQRVFKRRKRNVSSKRA